MRGSTAGAGGGAIAVSSAGTTSMDVDWSMVLSLGILVKVCSAVVVLFSASMAMGWTRVDLSIGTRARVDMSSSINFRKVVICVAITQTQIEVETAMGIGPVVRFIDIHLFNGSLYLEILVENNQGKGEPVTDVAAGFACERWLSFRYLIHPIHEMRSRVAVGGVPHTVVKGGTHGQIESLSVAY
uniref:Uncharacterized protein n=1 Tax=Romanomermis culicivorax TaxID=13658 RepID=A0A915LAJ9_ROMCU